MDNHRRTAAALATAIVMLALSATALAGTAFKSGTYKGTLAPPRTSITISLKLTGTRLSPVKLSSIPAYCSSGGPSPGFSFPAASISRTGTFKVTGINKIKTGPLKGQIGERLTLTGQFTKRGKVSGKLKTVFPKALTCGGTSAFTAKLR
jgi:hypothetical protein